MKAIDIAKTQAKGLIKMMFNAEYGVIKTEQRGEMIHGLKGSYSASLFSVDNDGCLIYENGSKKLVDIVRS
ncbi:hypothetical protein CCAL13119_03925 [Campylobacter sp. RM13119]|uniref:hypothetical protein n=1 Tax=Campylobacter californiensis TaxID=1032243 RepID=UPI001475062E|nr:hypothetical protein [Campylobacter sp. RM13119]MBE3606111.1 hypothetical protein [Campylobacter sp. RM13119]